MAGRALVAGTLLLTEIDRVKNSFERDAEHGTTRNRAEAGVSIVTAAKGAVDGFNAGMKVGAFLGIGSFVCGAIGAVCGAINYAFVSRKLANSIFDSHKYNIKELRCKECGMVYECRIYTDQSRMLCPKHDRSKDSDFRKVYQCCDCGRKYWCEMEKSLDDKLCPHCKDDDQGYYGWK